MARSVRCSPRPAGRGVCSPLEGRRGRVGSCPANHPVAAGVGKEEGHRPASNLGGKPDPTLRWGLCWPLASLEKGPLPIDRAFLLPAFSGDLSLL
jgi:hypothetical protein